MVTCSSIGLVFNRSTWKDFTIPRIDRDGCDAPITRAGKRKLELTLLPTFLGFLASSCNGERFQCRCFQTRSFKKDAEIMVIRREAEMKF